MHSDNDVTDLRSLLNDLRQHPDDWDWTGLPTFLSPAGTNYRGDTYGGPWSWDDTHMIVGTCEDDIRIEPRDDLGDEVE